MRFQKISQPLKNKYVFLRHGQTDANNKKIYMGRLDFPLNEIGVSQAKQIKLPFAPDIVLHSPLTRARQTALLAIEDYPCDLSPDDRLLEKAGGDIDGMAYSKIAEVCPETWGIWEDESLENIVKAQFPNGESDLHVARRLEDLLIELEGSYTERNILLVTHSGVIQVARYLSGQSKEVIYSRPIPNCQVELFE